MAIQEQLHTVDTLWDLARAPENDDKRFHLIDGKLFVFPRPRYYLQGRLVAQLSSKIYNHVLRNDLGLSTLGVGHYSVDDRHTVLGPAVAFLRKARVPMPLPDGWFSVMPDLAVELAAPGETLRHLRQKAAAYLRHGSSLVWILLTAEKGVDVCRAAEGSRLDIEFVSQNGTLTGEDVLPGFKLELKRLFLESADS